MIEMKSAIEAAVGFLAVLVSVPIVIAACDRWNIYDTPGPLKIHSRPIPRLGGIAITLGILAATAFAGNAARPFTQIFAVCVAIVAASAIIDDVRGVSPYIRLVIHASVGTFLGLSGFGIAATHSSALNAIFTAAVVIAFINAFNFIDGSDGVAAATTAVIAIGYIATAGPDFSAPSAAIAWALLGCAAAFLGFNWPPARIFMGDSGSTVLGLAVAFLALDHWRTASTFSNPASDLLPLVLAAVPLADAALAIVRRLQNFSSPFHGDRRHFYDLLLMKGRSPRAVAVAAAGLSVVSVVVGWITLRCSAAGAVALTAMYACALLIAGVRLGSIRMHRSPSVRATGTASASAGN
jgi:UDP-GlcNAc:undecaprenyl-phosphate/decaprenyl-phosphate GlcNAc-1-phosphate transferase